MNKLVLLLQYFYKITLKISSSHYVIVNSFFSKISSLHYMWNDWKEFGDNFVMLMDMNMKAKFDKY